MLKNENVYIGVEGRNLLELIINKLNGLFRPTESGIKSFQESVFSLQHSCVNPIDCTISCHDGVKNVPPRLMKLLILLVDNNQKTVSREQIMAELWPNTVVTDESINRAVADLRKTLGDSPNTSNIIKTITKQGYKLTLKPILLQTNTHVSKKVVFTLISVFVATLLTLTLWQFLTVFPTKSDKQGNEFNYVQSRLAMSGTHNRRPSISQNGNLIVTEKIDGEKHSLWLYDVSTDSEKLLLSDPIDDFSLPAISNDGLRLAYMRIKRDPTTYELHCQVEVYHLVLGSMRELSRCDYFSGADLSWSHNDERLLSSRYNTSTNINELVFIDVKMGDVSFLLAPQSANLIYRLPRISPSGKFVALLEVNTNQNTSRVTVIDLANNEKRYMTASRHNLEQVEWGMDDSVLYYSELAGANTGLWEVELESGHQVLMVNNQVVDFDFNRSNQSFVVSVAKFTSTIHALTLDNGRVFIDDNAHDQKVSVSADGKLLAYVSNRNGEYNIWTKSVVSGELKRVTNDRQSNYLSLKFSPDNRYLSYVVMGKKSGELVILDTFNNYSEVYRQTYVGSILWSKTGQYFYTYGKSNSSKIFKVSVADFSQQFVTEIDELHRLELTANEELIVQPRAWGPLYKLCCINDEPLVLEDANLYVDMDWIYNWNVSGEYVSLLEFENDRQVVNFYHPDGSISEDLKLTLPEGNHVYHYSYNEETRTLFYSSMKTKHFSLLKVEQVAK